MSIVLKRLVSKKKKRIKEKVNSKSYELDLSYITPQIIAMGFPCSDYQKLFRNSYAHVKGYLDGKHKGHYKLWNLCRERYYQAEKFEKRVSHDFRFFDHEAPPWDMLVPACQSIVDYLAEAEGNVAAIHCKAGKGRTGVIICAYLLYSGECKTVDEAFDVYAKARTKNNKGVTIPSQRRYIRYLGEYLNNNSQVPFPGQQLRLRLIRFHSPLKKALNLTFVVQDKDRNNIYTHAESETVTSDPKSEYTEIKCDVLIHDDCKIIVQQQKKGKWKELFHTWVNTQFVANGLMVLDKPQCDKAHKDKKHEKFRKDWQVEFVFHDRSGQPFPPPPMKQPPAAAAAEEASSTTQQALIEEEEKEIV